MGSINMELSYIADNFLDFMERHAYEPPIFGNLYKVRLTRDIGKRWQFPHDRFVEYGPEDESYCRMAGFGKEIEVNEVIEIPVARIVEQKVKGDRFTMSIEGIPLNRRNHV